MGPQLSKSQEIIILADYDDTNHVWNKNISNYSVSTGILQSG